MMDATLPPAAPTLPSTAMAALPAACALTTASAEGPGFAAWLAGALADAASQDGSAVALSPSEDAAAALREDNVWAEPGPILPTALPLPVLPAPATPLSGVSAHGPEVIAGTIAPDSPPPVAALQPGPFPAAPPGAPSGAPLAEPAPAMAPPSAAAQQPVAAPHPSLPTAEPIAPAGNLAAATTTAAATAVPEAMSARAEAPPPPAASQPHPASGDATPLSATAPTAPATTPTVRTPFAITADAPQHIAVIPSAVSEADPSPIATLTEPAPTRAPITPEIATPTPAPTAIAPAEPPPPDAAAREVAPPEATAPAAAAISPADEPGIAPPPPAAAAPIAPPPATAAPAAPSRPATPIPWPARQVAPFAIALALGPDASLSLTLEPAALGRVEVEIARNGSESQISLRAERPETLALLLRDRAELERALGDAGLGGEEGRGPNLSFSLGTGAEGRRERRSAPRETASQPAPDLRGGGRGVAPAGLPPPAAARGLLDLAI